MAVTLGDSARLRLLAPDTARGGEGITLGVEVRPLGRSVTVAFRGRPPAIYFAIRYKNGGEVWRTPGEGIFPVSSRFRLEPGDILRLVRDWFPRDSAGKIIAPGSYEIFGRALLIDGREVHLGPRTLIFE